MKKETLVANPLRGNESEEWMKHVRYSYRIGIATGFLPGFTLGGLITIILFRIFL